jgi:DNA polymerase-3 subunit gamma/tau
MHRPTKHTRIIALGAAIGLAATLAGSAAAKPLPIAKKARKAAALAAPLPKQQIDPPSFTKPDQKPDPLPVERVPPAVDQKPDPQPVASVADQKPDPQPVAPAADQKPDPEPAPVPIGKRPPPLPVDVPPAA